MKKNTIKNLVVGTFLVGTCFSLIKKINNKRKDDLIEIKDMKERNYILLCEIEAQNKEIIKEEKEIEKLEEETAKKLEKVKATA